ncbi:hypothetical protein SeMB42_g02692 [Synchytrium endobioticum]|uniref:Uncharacterized protein n=1 Tax=Synchytrium endobioticum TaxID=286115 RepID=A0A507DCB3_9FUNG|nr:hypothetical protein SeMB42_g02692 [Synchytrium endobioticum]
MLNFDEKDQQIRICENEDSRRLPFYSPIYYQCGLVLAGTCISLFSVANVSVYAKLNCYRPRELSVVCDVSCDTTIPNNPLPIYADTTTFGEPVLHLKTKGEAPLDVIAIDHLPALLPREASLVTCCQVEEMKSSQ